jgi:1-acyl-sn-glycerol-3-phosphate acyltransferase
MSWYRFFKSIIWVLMKMAARVRVEGRENLPDGPFVLIFNHQSFLDPLLAQSHCPPTVYSMTKSTQFAHPIFRWLVPRVGGFPVRRYRVDPQAVRTALRYLEEGKVVGVYPEGERSWDGVLQPFRRGTVRLLLKVGVPIVPCGLEGSFDVWPRWGAGVRRADVTIRFGEPIHLGRHDDRAERERLLPETQETLARILRRLSGEPEEGYLPPDPNGGRESG